MCPVSLTVTDALAAHRALDTLTPCFVVGPMKSGTTWLARALGEHPQIAASCESPGADVLLPRLDEGIDAHHATIDHWGRGPGVGLEAHDRLALERFAMDRLLLRYLRESGKPATAARIAGATDFRRFSGRPAGEERAMFYRTGVVGDRENHMTRALGEELRELAETKTALNPNGSERRWRPNGVATASISPRSPWAR